MIPCSAQIGDRDLQILSGKGIALDGDSIQLLHDPAADRNTVRFQLDVKEFRKILQADGAVHAIGILVQLFKIFLHLVVFVPNFTNQSSRISSIVTIPSVPPKSSTTTAIWDF